MPIGGGAAEFNTVAFERTVLVVVRNGHTTEWVLDFLAELVEDRRVQVVFSVDVGQRSVFDAGARASLRRAGVVEIPWSQATSCEFDLVLSSNHRGDLASVRGPLVLLNHGPGFGKPGSLPPQGVPPVPANAAELVAAGVAPTTVVLSHSSQRDLFDARPDVDFFVVGDPALDRLRGSRRWRARFRDALGVPAKARLVLLSSTWGPACQFARHPDLPLRLAAALPWDTYRVAMVVHPDVWLAHSSWQVRTWLRAALDSGVLVAQPEGDAWRGLLIASDLVLADHGSVAWYAAALDKPLALAGFSTSDVDERSPLHELSALAPTLDCAGPLLPQISEYFDGHVAGVFAAAVHQVFEPPLDRALVELQRTIYGLLGLSPARAPVIRAVSVPDVLWEAATSFVVDVTLTPGVLDLRRIPATAAWTGPATISSTTEAVPLSDGEIRRDRFLVANEGERNVAVVHSADAVWRERDGVKDRWLEETLLDLPGARVAAVIESGSTSALAVRRGASRFVVSTMDGLPCDPVLLVAACLAMPEATEGAVLVTNGAEARPLWRKPVGQRLDAWL